MSKTILKVVICLCFLASCIHPESVSNSKLKSSFLSPPDSARVRVWWHWMNGNVSREGITKDLEHMKAIGVGGLQQFDLDQYIPEGPVKHDSKEWHGLMSHAISEANRLGLEFGFNQCSGWSNSGGVWIKPENSMKTVVWSETQVKGGNQVSLSLEQPKTNLGFYRDIAVLVFPKLAGETEGETDFRIDNWKRKSVSFMGVNDVVYRLPRDIRPVSESSIIQPKSLIDLTSHLDSLGNLKWNAPAGDWIVIRFGYTTTGMINHPASKGAEGLECDKFSRKAVAIHWNNMVERVIADAGMFKGKTLTNVLIDSYEVAQQNWTDNFMDEFEKRRGYNLLQWLPCMTGRVVGSLDQSERFLWDIRRTVADLMTDNYFGYFAELCRNQGLKFAVEPYGSGCFDSFQGDMAADVPMGEFWINWAYSPWYWSSNKMASSAAHLGGKPIAAAEAFTSMPNNDRWSTYPAKLKKLGDLVYTLGVNRFHIHGCVHQPWGDEVVPGMTMGPWGLHFDRNNTWSPHARSWLDYMARCQTMLQQGRFSADLLYIYSEDAPNSAEQRSETEPNPPLGYDYDCGGYKILSELKVKDGRIVAPSGMSYRMLILPYAKYSIIETKIVPIAPNPSLMRPETLEQIARLAKEGAIIIGDKPLQSPSLSNYPACDARIKELTDELWDNGKVFALRQFKEVINKYEPIPDFETPGNSEMAYIHRKIDNCDYYYVSNQQDKSREVVCRFRVTGKQPELWNPMNGEMINAPNWKVLDDKQIEVTLDLETAGSIFVVFDQSTNSKGKVTEKPSCSEVAKVDGPWTVTFGKFGPKEPVLFRKLIPWNEHADNDIKYFSGTATYATTFEFSGIKNEQESVILDLGQVQVLAKVSVNGNESCTLWMPPYRLDITQSIHPGRNELKVMVVNLWANRLIGDDRFPEVAPLNTERPYGRWIWQGSYKELPKWLQEGKPPVGPRKTFSIWRHWDMAEPLLPSGLIGPVMLLKLTKK